MPWFELQKGPVSVLGAQTNTRMELTKMSDAIIYNPRVAKSEITMFRKIEFVKISLTVRGLPPVFSIF